MSPDLSVYLLDSFALLAYFNDEAGRERVTQILDLARQAKCRVMISLLNLGEVLYIVERRLSVKQAQIVLAVINTLPLEQIDVTRDIILDAAHIKAHHPISYADAIAVAVAQQHNATILTGDPEFNAVTSLVTVEWLV